MDQQNQNQLQSRDENLREQVQVKVVELITRKLENGSISEDRARSIAQMILERLPTNISNQELMQVLPQLDDEFTELSDIVLPILVEYEEKVRQAVESKVLRLVKLGKFTEARDMARKGIEFSQQLNNPPADETPQA